MTRSAGAPFGRVTFLMVAGSDSQTSSIRHPDATRHHLVRRDCERRSAGNDPAIDGAVPAVRPVDPSATARCISHPRRCRDDVRHAGLEAWTCSEAEGIPTASPSATATGDLGIDQRMAPPMLAQSKLAPSAFEQGAARACLPGRPKRSPRADDLTRVSRVAYLVGHTPGRARCFLGTNHRCAEL